MIHRGILSFVSGYRAKIVTFRACNWLFCFVSSQICTNYWPVTLINSRASTCSMSIVLLLLFFTFVVSKFLTENLVYVSPHLFYTGLGGYNYFCSFSSMLCNCLDAANNAFWNIVLRGLWSVWIVTIALSYIHWSNFVHANTITKHSFSICA